LLLLKVKNILANRAKIREKFRVNSVEFNISETNPLDQKFIENLNKFISENYAESEFRMEDLFEELSISQSQLNKKCKKLTGKSPVELIFEYRMNVAKTLIEENQYTISEIAYKVGFSDPKYFSKRFKEYYHATPSDIKSK